VNEINLFDQLGELTTTYGWWAWAGISLLAGLFLFLRYALLVGIFHGVFRGKRFGARRVRLSPKPRSEGQTRRELAYAAATTLIFGISTAVMLAAWQNGWIRIYEDVSNYSLAWLPCSLIIAMLVHETYYYWLHRGMHHPRFYNWLHRGHHDSIVTSGWTSFAFDPGEAILQAAIIPLILLVIPMHWTVLVIWLTLMTISAIINHAGIELWPQPLNRTWWGRNVIGATHHGLHHTQFVKNYGLYFTFWDRWMGTESEALNEDGDA